MLLGVVGREAMAELSEVEFCSKRLSSAPPCGYPGYRKRVCDCTRVQLRYSRTLWTCRMQRCAGVGGMAWHGMVYLVHTVTMLVRHPSAWES